MGLLVHCIREKVFILGERDLKEGQRGQYLLVIFLHFDMLCLMHTCEAEGRVGDLERRYLKYETSELGDCPRCGSQLYPGMSFVHK